MGTLSLQPESSSIRGMGEFFSIAILREDGDNAHLPVSSLL